MNPERGTVLCSRCGDSATTETPAGPMCLRHAREVYIKMEWSA